MDPKMETEHAGGGQTTVQPLDTKLLAGQSNVDLQYESDSTTELLNETFANDTITGDISTDTIIEVPIQTNQLESISLHPVINAENAISKKILKQKRRNERQKEKRRAAKAGNSKKEDSVVHGVTSTPTTSTTIVNQNRMVQPADAPLTASSSKRKRGTPLNDSKNAKRRDQKSTPQLRTGQSYSSVVVESHLIMAIMHTIENSQKLVPATKELYTEVFYALNEIMFEEMDTKGFLPSFHNTRVKQRVIRIACKCAESRLWLLGIAGRLSEKVKKNLTVCDFDKIPHQRKFFAFFPYVKQDNDKILRLLNACNPQLQEIKWEVIRRKEISSGINLLITVEEETAVTLISNNGSLGFGAGTAHFRELTPRSKRGTVDESEKVNIRLDDETTDAEEESLDKLANLTLAEAEKKHTDKTVVKSDETSDKAKPAKSATEPSQGKVQFTIKGMGKTSTSTGIKSRKKKKPKHKDGTGTSAETEKGQAQGSDVTYA